jgi:hypothetical protein
MPLGNDLPLLLVLLAALLLVVAIVLLIFSSRHATRQLTDVDLGDGPLEQFRGGLRWPLPAGLGATNTPPVLVGLELFDWGVRIGARWGWLRPFVPTWFARYEEIRAVEHVKRTALRMSRRNAEGVCLRAAVRGAPLIFWTSATAALLDLFEERGVVVVRSPRGPRLWSNT